MKRKAIQAPTKVYFSIVITSVTWLYPSMPGRPKPKPQMVPSASAFVAYATPSKLNLSKAAQRWIQFQTLRREWLVKRGATSSIPEMSMQEPYQRIIGMGEVAVPLILAQLRREGDEPDQWFWALRVLTDANPVTPENQGDFRAMARAWIDWGATKEFSEHPEYAWIDWGTTKEFFGYAG